MEGNSVNTRLMTLKEVAAYLRVTEKTIHRLLEKNAIPAVKVGRLWRFDNNALNKWLNENAVYIKNQILVIDDEKSVRLLIKATLEKSGHNVVTTGSGTDGLDLIKKQDFNLVFLDLKMPDIDGAEIFKQIKTIKPEMQVIVITGYPESDLMMKALAYGPFGVMQKPFSGTDIIQVLNCFLRISR